MSNRAREPWGIWSDWASNPPEPLCVCTQSLTYYTVSSLIPFKCKIVAALPPTHRRGKNTKIWIGDSATRGKKPASRIPITSANTGPYVMYVPLSYLPSGHFQAWMTGQKIINITFGRASEGSPDTIPTTTFLRLVGRVGVGGRGKGWDVWIL